MCLGLGLGLAYLGEKGATQGLVLFLSQPTNQPTNQSPEQTNQPTLKPNQPTNQPTKNQTGHTRADVEEALRIIEEVVDRLRLRYAWSVFG
jgi:hypothetical protein